MSRDITRRYILSTGAAVFGATLAPSVGRGNDASGPKLPGEYKPSSGVHPFISTSQSKLQRFLSSRSQIVDGAIRRLENDTRTILASQSLLKPPYAGCDLDEYLLKFSGDAEGAAPRVQTLATYAYLSSLKTQRLDQRLGDAASAAAIAAIRSWSEAGFRNYGRLMDHSSAYCGKQGAQTVNVLVGLQIGRGMIPFVNAIDLLQGRDSIQSGDLPPLKSFLRNQLNVVLESANAHASQALVCGRFDNQASAHLWAITVIARYLDDTPTIEAVAGRANSGILKLSWPNQINGAIYGRNDRPRPCYEKPEKSTYFQTTEVAPGEIVDRFRGKPYQPFGYTLGSLASLTATADILESIGYQAYSYRGPQDQSLRLALDYYAFYLKTFMSPDAISLPKSGISYPNFAQYAGQPFTRANGATIEDKDALLTPFVLGRAIYPNDAEIEAVIQKAFSFQGLTPFVGINPMFLDRLPGLTRA